MLKVKDLIKNEEKFGKCCNACFYWHTDAYDMPCLSCKSESKWKSCK